MRRWTIRTLLVLFGVLLGSGLTFRWQHGVIPPAIARVENPPPAQRQNPLPTTESLPAEVARLKSLVPSQSHAMMDVQFHWTNLWFAARKKNWPLAQFYFDESRQHMLWMIHIRPIRKGPDNADIDLQGIFDGVDNSSLAAVKNAIAAKNEPQFESAYKTMLESYACHKASAKPYLRPMILEAPDQSIINFDPDASWPQ